MSQSWSGLTGAKFSRSSFRSAPKEAEDLVDGESCSSLLSYSVSSCRAHTNEHMHTAHIGIYTDAHVGTEAHVHICTHTCGTHTSTHKYAHRHMGTRTWAHAHVCIHTCTYTHTRTQPLGPVSRVEVHNAVCPVWWWDGSIREAHSGSCWLFPGR